MWARVPSVIVIEFVIDRYNNNNINNINIHINSEQISSQIPTARILGKKNKKKQNQHASHHHLHSLLVSFVLVLLSLFSSLLTLFLNTSLSGECQLSYSTCAVAFHAWFAPWPAVAVTGQARRVCRSTAGSWWCRCVCGVVAVAIRLDCPLCSCVVPLFVST